MPTRSEFLRILALSGASPFLFSRSVSAQLPKQTVRDIGARRELFVDDFLIERMDGVSLKLHEPVNAGTAILFDRPWEGAFCGYVTVLRDGDRFRMYYRGLPVSGADGSSNETTCLAESGDGVSWRKPDLDLYTVSGIRETNIVLAGMAPFSHNFSPFVDTRPGLPQSERCKAVAGTVHSGLTAFASPDGLRWRKLREEPILKEGAFDSQNVAFWSEKEGCYVCYFRTWTGGGFKGFRTVSRATSPDFRTWSAPEPMTFGDTPPEHLYTNQTTPYFRAPHICIAFPMRFLPGRKVLTPEQAKSLGVDPGYSGDCADCVFMTSRGGARYDRTFMEGFIRPGADLGNWASRAGMAACGIIPTGPAEISLFKQANYAQPTAHLLRYTLRTDGFASVCAPYRGGEMLTHPLRFSGPALALNFATSAAGSIRIEIRDESNRPIPGFTLAESDEIVGDSIERMVTWKGNPDVSGLEGKAVRLRFVMKDADVFAVKFS
jgi:hypothetical protein